MVPEVQKSPSVPKPGRDVQVKLGAVVRACRQHLGITQDELAWRSDMHRTYIADIERGARNVTLRSIVNLARALDVTVGSLLTHATAPGEVSPRFRNDGVLLGPGEILLIEDNPWDSAMAARAFKRAKVTNPLRIVRDAETGLDLLMGRGRYARKKPVKPHLILLDLNLPGMSGLDFLRQIKADRRTRDIPVVVLTITQSDIMIIECGRLGAENYIVKPIGIENFVRVTPKLNLQLTVGPLQKPAGPARRG
jgi:CheY-like chemotaxis protein/DNA-binding XRE family transcriptional regulator